MKKNIVIGCMLAFIAATLCWAADIRNSAGILCTDKDNAKMQSPPAYLCVDGTASVKQVTNIALTSSVVTITSASHGFKVGQQVVIALLTGSTLANGTFIITGVATDTFTYASVQANISTIAATGTATAYYASEIPTGTTEIALVFPPKAFHLVLIPTVANVYYSKVTVAGTQGKFIAYVGVGNGIDGMEGDTVFVQRANTTPLDFVFDCTR